MPITPGLWTSRWVPGTEEIVSRGQGQFMRVAIDASSGFSQGTPSALFADTFVNDIGGNSYDVTRDGQRFLVIQESTADRAAEDRIDVIINGVEEVKARVPTR